MGKSAAQIVHEAILNDRDLKGLNQMLFNVHNRATKTTVWNPDAKELTHILNEPYKSEAMELVKNGDMEGLNGLADMHINMGNQMGLGAQDDGMPANLQEWAYYNQLPAEDQKRYLEMKRNPTYFQTNVGGVPTVVSPSSTGTGTTPLSTLSNEAAAKEALAGAEMTGKTTAEGQAKQAAAQAKRSATNEESTFHKLKRIL